MLREADSFEQDMCSWGTLLEGGDADLDLAFYGTACPASDQMTDLTVTPPGPLCFGCGSPRPNQTTDDAVWQVLAWGDCEILEDDQSCIVSHEGVGRVEYSTYSSCGFRALQPGSFAMEYFSVEEGYDFLKLRFPMGGREYMFSGQDPPGLDGLTIEAGTDILWDSDESVEDFGWRLCLV